MNKWTRRTFIGAGTIAGGGFLLGVGGFTFAPGRHTVVSADAADKGQLTTWVTVTPDNLGAILRGLGESRSQSVQLTLARGGVFFPRVYLVE